MAFSLRWLRHPGDIHPEARRDILIALLLVLAAIALYSPGITWGLPQADAPGKTRPWGADELGPIGPIVELRNTLGGDNLGNPQYPLFHYIVIFVFYAPYLLFQGLTGGLVDPHGGYPFGFTSPATSVQTLLVIARGVSVLMAAGLVAGVYALAKSIWDRATAILAAVLVLLLYPMFYYAKVSTVDMAALFWSVLVLIVFVRVWKDGLPMGRALALGLLAALAIATKDQAYAFLLPVGLAVVPLHFRALREQGRYTLANRWAPLVAGLGFSLAVYAVASGLVLRPEKYFRHIEYVRFGSKLGRFYYEYEATLAGYWGLFRECLNHVLASIHWPLLLVALAGVALSVARERQRLLLLLPIPGLFIFAFMPVRYTELRYVLGWCVILACFAAHALMSCWRTGRWAARVGVALLLAASGGWMLARGLDINYGMLNDPRYAAADWLAQYGRNGDRVEYFGPVERTWVLPRLKPGLALVGSGVRWEIGDGALQGEFVLAQGREDMVYHWGWPPWVYRGLLNGSLGYDLVAEFKPPTRFVVQDFDPTVNPHVQIFARRDRAAEIRQAAANAMKTSP